MANQFATQMRVAVEDAKAKGTASIYCDTLIEYLKGIENAPMREATAAEIEHSRATFQAQIETSKREHEGALEMFRAVITAGQNAIKTSFLLNGGAAVAMLAFIAHLTDKQPNHVAEFAYCLVPFTIGVLVIAVTSGLTYLTQWLYQRTSLAGRKAGFWVNILCIASGIASYLLFTWGLCVAYQTFVAFK